MIRLISLIFLAGFSVSSFAQQGMNMTELSVFFPSNLTPGNSQFNDCWGYAAPDGREYGILGHAAGTYFADITDPANPVEIDYFPGGNSTIWRDYKTYKHYAFGVSDGFGGGSLQIWDLQYLPDSIVEVYNSSAFSSNVHNIFINDDRLYLVSNNRGGSFYPLDILCIEDPENPYLIGGIRNGINVPSPLSSHDAFVRGDTVYLSAAGDGLQVFDFADAENPVFIGSIENYPGKGYNHSSWMSTDGTHMVMADETGGSPLKIIDISDLSNIQTVSTFPANPPSNLIPHNPFVKNCIAFVSYYHLGVQVYDISVPASPTQVAFFDTDTTTSGGFDGCWGVYPYLPSGNIIASDQKKGLYVLSYDSTFPCAAGIYDDVYEVDTSKYCEDTTTSPVSLRELTAENISLFPNPTDGLFHLISDQNVINEVEVYDIRGKVILRRSLANFERDIILNLSTEESGLYFVNVHSNGGQKRLKLFKK
ncbi:MAG: choice-of-anchor B family protein [Cytophagales bacterium]